MAKLVDFETAMKRAVDYAEMADSERRNEKFQLATAFMEQANFWLKYAKNLLDNIVVN